MCKSPGLRFSSLREPALSIQEPRRNARVRTSAFGSGRVPSASSGTGVDALTALRLSDPENQGLGW